MQVESSISVCDPFLAAVRLADEVQVPMPLLDPDAPVGATSQRLLRICYWLHTRSTNGTFELPVRSLALAFPAWDMYAPGRWRRHLEFMGVLETVEKHIPGKKATRFRLTDRYAAELQRMMRETSN